VTITNNEIILEINGLVCSFCAMGLNEVLSSLIFVDKDKYKDGVFIDTNYQYVIISIITGTKINVKEISQKISDAGYELKIIYMKIAGGKIKSISLDELLNE